MEDAKCQDAYAPPYPSVFLPLLQDVTYQDPSEISMQARTNHAQNIELLVAGQTVNLEALIRQTLATTDPNLTVLKLTSLGEQVSLNFNQERLVSRLTGLLGCWHWSCEGRVRNQRGRKFEVGRVRRKRNAGAVRQVRRNALPLSCF